MPKKVLMISNTKTFSKESKKEIDYLLDLFLESSTEIHIFREDMNLYDVLRDNENVRSINALSSGADLLLFNRENEGFYNVHDAVKLITPNFEQIYKKAISRFISPSRDKAFDELDYKSRRLSVMNSRMRYAISQIADTYQFVVMLKDSKENNLLNTLTPEWGDGKYIYIYDCIKKSRTFYVGGCVIFQDNFEKWVRECD